MIRVWRPSQESSDPEQLGALSQRWHAPCVHVMLNAACCRMTLGQPKGLGLADGHFFPG